MTLDATGVNLVGNLLVNGGDIGITADTNLLSLASNLLTVNGAITATGNIITGSQVGIAADTDLIAMASGALTVNGTLYTTGNFSVGIASGDGTCHIHTGSAGSVTALFDDLVVESNTAGGVTVLTPDAIQSGYYLGSPANPTAARMTWQHSTSTCIIGTEIAGATVYISSGNGFAAIAFNENRDIEFPTAGSGLAYAGLSVEGNAVATAIGVVSTWYQVTVFDTEDPNNVLDPVSGDSDITIELDGAYYVSVFASVFSAGTNQVYEMEVRRNNGVTRVLNVHADRKVAVGGDIGSFSGGGLVSLSAGDTVELWVQNKTSATDLTFEDVTLSIFQLGG